MTDYERDQAIKQGHCNAASEAYFEPRRDFRITGHQGFDAGFDRGWDAGRAPLHERIAALEAKLAQRVPDGWKTVPVEPTPSMWTAGGKAIKACGGHERDAACLAYSAMLAAAPEQQEEPKRCPNCDDTGDVHSIDGEWRGVCHCPAGQALSAKPVAQASNAQQAEAQEPCAWRVHPFDYGIGSAGVYAVTQFAQQAEAWRKKGWAAEPLFTRPQPAQLTAGDDRRHVICLCPDCIKPKDAPTAVQGEQP